MYDLMYILIHKIQSTGWVGDLKTSILLCLDDEALRNGYTEFILKMLSAFQNLSQAFYLHFTL